MGHPVMDLDQVLSTNETKKENVTNTKYIKINPCSAASDPGNFKSQTMDDGRFK